MKRPTRRTVILTSGALAGVAGLSTLGVRWYLDDGSAAVLDRDASDDDRWAAFKVHMRLRHPYLTLPEATLDAFIADARAQKSQPPHHSGALATLRKTLLLSTDFFLKGQSEKTPLSYVAYFDPYVTPCWNPLVRQ